MYNVTEAKTIPEIILRLYLTFQLLDYFRQHLKHLFFSQRRSKLNNTYNKVSQEFHKS